MSFTIIVPTAVPSVFQISKPFTPSVALKSIVAGGVGAGAAPPPPPPAPPPLPPPQALRKNNSINAASSAVWRLPYLMIDLDLMIPPPLTFKGYCLDFPLFSSNLYHQSV